MRGIEVYYRKAEGP